MSADPPEFEKLQRHHREHRAPSNAQARAVARFAAAQPRRNPWPGLATALVVLCVVLFVSGVVRKDDPMPELAVGAAGLSLNQIGLPPWPSVQLSDTSPAELSTADLSTATNFSLGVPNLSQLSETRIEIKETI